MIFDDNVASQITAGNAAWPFRFRFAVRDVQLDSMI